MFFSIIKFLDAISSLNLYQLMLIINATWIFN